jgi:hypothetical protein
MNKLKILFIKLNKFYNNLKKKKKLYIFYKIDYFHINKYIYIYIYLLNKFLLYFSKLNLSKKLREKNYIYFCLLKQQIY